MSDAEKTRTPATDGLLCRARALLHSVWRVLVRARVRSEWATRVRFRGLHFQGETFTAADRYPALFTQCRTLLADVAEPAILSFGCSTGEEAQTLGRYLPNAQILGVDINPWCVRTGTQRNRNARITFAHRLSVEFAEAGSFDAIFCMAVFQRTEHRLDTPETITGGFTFDTFAREIAVLDSKLRPDGLLFIDHCDFRFTDTATADRYRALHFPRSERLRERPLFGPDNRLLGGSHIVQRCFRKLRQG